MLLNKYILLIVYFIEVKSARILGIVPTASYSHQIAFRPLWKELSLRGHQVTVITTDPIQNSQLVNLTEIDISSLYEVLEKNGWQKMLLEAKDDMKRVWKFVVDHAFEYHDEIFFNPQVKNLIENNSIEFDMVMIEYLNPSFFPFQHRFNAPFIGISSMDVTYLAHDCLGNPSHPVMNPDVFLPFTNNLTFFQRLVSTVFAVSSRKFFQDTLEGFDVYLASKYFGSGYPPLKEIACRLDMLFLNINPIFNSIRPMVPAVISIGGGMHLTEPKPLPKDLQTFLDLAANGAIYFSLGTNVQSSLITNKTKNVILEVFTELPFQVLWKFEQLDLPGKPANVKIIDWVPQQDILRHPNIKLFITQGGIQSLEEALFNHVPMIGIPFFADQFNNVNKMVEKGIGLQLNIDEITKEKFLDVIWEVINNPKYKNKEIEIASLSLDQPLTGLQKAVWWTEYVIRHKGAQHLKHPFTKIPTYQYYLVDVIGFVLICLLFVIILLLMVLRLCLVKIRNKYKKD